jgi:uncharacterized protein (TIGR02271 family)
MNTGMNTGTTSNRSNYVVALFRERNSAQVAIHELQNAGFRAHEIGYALEEPSTAGIDREAHDQSFWQKVESFFTGKEEYEDRGTGSMAEGGAENTLAENTLTVPDSYREHLRSGSTLVAVLAGGRRDAATNIFTRNGGEIRTDFDQIAGRTATGTDLSGGDRIQLLSERLRINKQRVATGEARIRKEVITENQTVQVPVQREELVVERMPASGDVSARGPVGTSSEVRVPLSEERVTVDKQPVVREEVRVGKKSVQEVRNVSDSVRHEELKVEDSTRKAKDRVAGDRVSDVKDDDPLKRKSA